MDEGSCKKDFLVVSLGPDVCKSPTAPVPYNIVARLADSVNTAERVHFHAKRSSDTFTLDSRITTLSGDEAGVGGGVVSGVNKGWCRPINASATVFAQGGGVLQSERSYFDMNCAGPEGPGNTIGQLIYNPPQATADIGPGGSVGPCNPLCLSETPSEAGFLDALSGAAGGDVMDWAEQAYGLSQIDWSNPAGVLGAIGDVAGLAGIGGLADAAQLARMGCNLATMDWSDPAGVLGALGGVAGLAGLTDVARLARLGGQAHRLAGADWSNPAALLQGLGLGAGLLGHQGIAQAAGAARQAHAIATTDWRNPGAIVGAAMNVAGMLDAENMLLPNPNGPTRAPQSPAGLPPGLLATPAFVPLGSGNPERLERLP